MGTTITAPLTLNAAADAAAASTALTSNTGTSSGGSAASAVGTNALQSLGTNFNEFLNLLMTQLQNQDPTAPMDSNQFTTELVQFTGVQQQVATNSSLTQLISMQQTSQVLQSSSLVGQIATVSSARSPSMAPPGRPWRWQWSTRAASPSMMRTFRRKTAAIRGRGTALTIMAIRCPTAPIAWPWRPSLPAAGRRRPCRFRLWGPRPAFPRTARRRCWIWVCCRCRFRLWRAFVVIRRWKNKK